jgi:excisionase family DNA binding protein
MGDTLTILPSAGEAAAKVDSATYTVRDIAALLQASERHVWRLHDGGKMPACVRLGRLVRWPKKLIDDWIASGCPAQPKNSRL